MTSGINFIMDKQKLIRNFSRYAHLYDKYAEVQKTAALELLEQISKNNFKKILEIGCGTGNYTLILREAFKNARLKAIDISDKMIEVAQDKLKDKEIEFMVGDAEEINLNESFDLISSNACFQWFEDLEKALAKYRNLLNKGGVISFSIFGPLTFLELNTSLRFILKDVSIVSTNFITKERIKEIFKKSFKENRIKEVRYEETYLKLKDLLNKIKYTGIRGEGLNGKIFFTPELLNRIEDFYLDKFRQIKTTYQVFFCQGRRA